MNDTIRKFWKTIEWFRQPRLTLTAVKVAGWVLGIAVMICWYLTGTFTGGVLSVLTFCLMIVGWRVWVWLHREHSRETESGVTISFAQRVRNLFGHSKDFTETDENWERFIRAKGLLINGSVPKITHKSLTLGGDVKGLIQPGLLGGDLQTLSTAAVQFGCGPMRCQEINVVETATNSGSGWITFYKVPPLRQVRSILELPVAPKGSDGTLMNAFGITQEGEVAAVPDDLSILISGATESGKSGLVWGMIGDYERRGIYFEIVALDPKNGMELKGLAPLEGTGWHGFMRVAKYSTDVDEAVEMMDEFRAEMFSRQGRVAGRKMLSGTKEFPKRIFLIDELLTAKALLVTTKTKATSMEIVLSQGRGTGDRIIALAQLSKVSTIGDMRDLFPTKACMRVLTLENAKAALGVDAPAHKIKTSEKGVGFIVNENGTLTKFRGCWANDDHVTEIVTGFPPKGMITQRPEDRRMPHYGYRAMNNHVGHIYTGETNKKQRRYKEHHRDDVWKGTCPLCGLVDSCRWWANHVDFTVSCKFRSREEARVWEEREIKALHPMFNIAHNGNRRPLDPIRRRTYRGPVMTRDDAPAPSGVMVWNLDPKRQAWVARAADAPRWAPWRKTVKPLPELVDAGRE